MIRRWGFWPVIIAGTLIIFISMGTRQSFGIFMHPLSAGLGLGRETFSLAMALQNLILGLPLAGFLSDRFGPRLTLITGGVVYAVALYLMQFVHAPESMHLVLGLMMGLALSAVTFVVVIGAVGQSVPKDIRGAAFGFVTAAGSAGMFGMVIVAQWFWDAWGWQLAFERLGWIAALIVLMALIMPANPPQHAEQREPELSISQCLSDAFRHQGYWMLNLGFFVCGFHVAFIATHLPAYAMDQGLTGTEASQALALIGLFNILGSFAFGWLGDRFRRKWLLTLLYILRAIVISGFLLIPITATTALWFGALIGFLWLATVPLTSGLVSQLFGVRYLGTLFGIVFLSHQLGAFIGVWWGGRMFDTTGSYEPVWWTAVLLGLAASGVHAVMSDQKK